MFYGTAGPQLSSGAGFLGTGSRALHRHNMGLHIHSALQHWHLHCLMLHTIISSPNAP